MSTRIQYRRNTAAAAAASNPVLAVGEPGLETDTGGTKMGDGVTAWTSLPYDAAPMAATSVKTAAYAAAANQLVPVDATSAPVTVTLPTSPAVGTRVAVKKIDTSANLVTIAAGGANVFNKAGGSTSLTLTLANQSGTYQYAAGGIWYVASDDFPLSGLDSRFLSPATANATYVPQLQAQSAEGTNVVLFKVTPKTAGWGAFKAITNSYANSAATRNHAGFIGWNPSDTSPHGAEVAGKVALVIGFEDNFYDSAGDGNHGPEFYIEQQTPTADASLFRPFYARGSNETGHNRWNIQLDIGTDGNGVFSIYAGKLNPLLFTVQPTGAQFTTGLTVSGAGVTLAPPTGQPLFIINRTTGGGGILQFQNAGSAIWSLMAESATVYTIYDGASSPHLQLTKGASVTLALTNLASSLKVQGNVGFYGTTPATKPTVTGAKGSNAALASLLTALASQGLLTDSSTA